jgi:hypothetical protein
VSIILNGISKGVELSAMLTSSSRILVAILIPNTVIPNKQREMASIGIYNILIVAMPHSVCIVALKFRPDLD